jgi:hypothetical protein
MAKPNTFIHYLLKRNGLQFYGAWLLLPIIFFFASGSQLSISQAVSQLTLETLGKITIIEAAILLILYCHYRISKR